MPCNRFAVSSYAVFSFGVAFSCAATITNAFAVEKIAASISPAVLDRALGESADGYSTDEVILRDDLRSAFFDSIAEQTATEISLDDQAGVLLDLLKARKAGKLTYRSVRRSRRIKDDCSAVAEIAARVVSDRHRVTVDTMLVNPTLRAELQQEAELISPGVDAYAVRKSILGLRKKRSLKPELVLQVADWDREVMTWSLAELRAKVAADEVPHQPGIYLFRTDEGYLYIGEAVDLSDRLAQHTADSDRIALADHLSKAAAGEVSVELHVFPKNSPAAKVGMRRAYESELIRSRHPKLNVRP
ncbi:hypothetical protein LF1_03240 [Rubripirellula obstinata]|uniref:GIY-YIG domain-containing protein n=1 Tax=Rubripirellula obstinata TaxID=406547 RepID=A0A5B1CER9_9BACT|nr:GIY-YIG nuclease family protein [Rubripirellula obstinata]KAA1257834.1 hypothetical protein LF1_03240 [Rubripirellula obstinata]